MHTYWLWLALHPVLSEHEKSKLARCCDDPEALFFPDREGTWPEELDELVKKARSRSIPDLTGACSPGWRRTAAF